MNIAILIPTIKGREAFLNQAMTLLSEQTLEPAFIEVVDDIPPFEAKQDIAWKYKIGINRCLDRKADLIIFWEDDDWYRYDYIEFMVKHWVLFSSPDVFGLSKTIYYNIVKRKYFPVNHPGRASMMSTLITKNIVPDWEDERDPWVDITLWKKKVPNHAFDIPFDNLPTVGIKHGIGNCGGGGHFWSDTKFKYDDVDLRFLKSMVDADSLNFYSNFYRYES